MKLGPGGKVNKKQMLSKVKFKQTKKIAIGVGFVLSTRGVNSSRSSVKQLN